MRRGIARAQATPARAGSGSHSPRGERRQGEDRSPQCARCLAPCHGPPHALRVTWTQRTSMRTDLPTRLLTGGTGMPVLDAEADFRRARRAYRAARIGRRLARRPSCSCPLTLGDSNALPAGTRRLEVVQLGSIVGTLEPTAQFDARFRPASEALRSRWQRIALAHRIGSPLPPITVWRRSKGLYVVDGRHRVSVALAFGQSDIDAWVAGPPHRLAAGRAGSPSVRP